MEWRRCEAGDASDPPPAARIGHIAVAVRNQTRKLETAVSDTVLCLTHLKAAPSGRLVPTCQANTDWQQSGKLWGPAVCGIVALYAELAGDKQD